jgi:hypothetical protein
VCKACKNDRANLGTDFRKEATKMRDKIGTLEVQGQSTQTLWTVLATCRGTVVDTSLYASNHFYRLGNDSHPSSEPGYRFLGFPYASSLRPARLSCLFLLTTPASLYTNRLRHSHIPPSAPNYSSRMSLREMVEDVSSCLQVRSDHRCV